ncbi:MAG: hypothetical protein ABIB61_04200 [Candidatus Shapirobacteria bacterium]
MSAEQERKSLRGEAIFDPKGKVIGCSLHPNTTLFQKVGDGVEVNWCTPHDGSDSHLLIERPRMSAEELGSHAWEKPKPIKDLEEDQGTIIVRDNLPHPGLIFGS